MPAKQCLRVCQAPKHPRSQQPPATMPPPTPPRGREQQHRLTVCSHPWGPACGLAPQQSWDSNACARVRHPFVALSGEAGRHGWSPPSPPSYLQKLCAQSSRLRPRLFSLLPLTHTRPCLGVRPPRYLSRLPAGGWARGVPPRWPNPPPPRLYPFRRVCFFLFRLSAPRQSVTVDAGVSRPAGPVHPHGHPSPGAHATPSYRQRLYHLTFYCSVLPAATRTMT